jgi:hypothetical protein
MEEPDSLSEKRAILEYWTLVEFFSPYVLENSLSHKQNLQKIYADELSNELLPWWNAQTIEEDDPATPYAKGFRLYLGLFSVEETADRARHTFTSQPSQWQSINWKSSLEAGGTTCFARLTVTTHGIPLFGTLTLSTLPWAHGRLLDGKEQSLTMEQYWKSVSRLLHSLREELLAELPTKLMKKPKQHAGYLDAKAHSTLMEKLCEWAGYLPKGYPLALIETLSGNTREEARDPQIKTERSVPILNSFYIQDLESAAISLSNQKGKPIDRYLCNNEENRILLESEEGAKAILATLRPEKFPFGRWPDPLSHQQSLMQQFAINAMFGSIETNPIFSINGPPGTGKTSLLREIIAANIVARAVALSRFETAKKAFIGRQALNFENNDPLFISELDPSLHGYEMLVVSSNNAAVQNLSNELPLRSQLDPSFHHASYLESVATKTLGLKEKEAWGLISATLGNVENCRHFVESAFMVTNDEEAEARVWEWVDGYDGPSFNDARESFIKIKNRQEQLFHELEMLAFLHEEINGHTVETYCTQALEDIKDAEEITESINIKLSCLIHEEVEAKEHLKLLQEREHLWRQERPNALNRMIDRNASKTWAEKLSAFRQERIVVIEELQKSKTDLKELRNKLLEQNEIESDKGEKLFDRALLFHSYQGTYHELKKIHPTARLPKGSEELTEKEVHTQSFYMTQEVNRVRSELFVAAMDLHEAWLAETSLVKGGFRGNLMAIANILQGKIPTTADDTRLAWQSVFLLLPVISSTFASIGRLFRHLEPGTLGWALIDEAGQAIPQAAVGAIWRAKRVVSIGDPFQIEPMCTVPAEVMDGMAKNKIKDFLLNWAPSQVSVQNLMDRTSIFGSKRHIQEESYWIGSPLRVHRRCQEPMFSIANAIAYEGSMLLATLPGNEVSLPPSSWWDVCGPAKTRQYVVEQGDALVHLLMDAFAKMNKPDLYVISPFREVITQLQKLILKERILGEIFKQKYPFIPLQHWVQQAIGTVHTFQGKEAAVVFFVLGADRSTLGAVEWASRKPNLLNVAVTRAQSRFYIIGDYNLWKTWPHFDVAAKKLERRALYRNEFKNWEFG